ncbi:MAG: hypothetical protein HC875_27970 [Anaerolineales bacterium]|nr:hypothetical protein [Anaerolineales bacterium]
MAAPPENNAITQNTDVVIIHGITFVEGEATVAATNNVTTHPNDDVFLPLIIK